MEEIRAVAFAFYEAGSAELKQKAKAIFNEMDVDGDGKISISEFTKFMKRYKYDHKSELFQEIDRDHSGFLDFWEVVVFFYITETRKVLCDGCGYFMKGTYFTCTDCFYGTGGYDLCCACYRSKKYESGHGPFLDNYAMLNKLQQQPPPPPPRQQQSQVTNRDNGSSTEQFLKRLQLSQNVGTSLGTTIANLQSAGACSIM